MIRVGVAGWDYPDWEGIVYPSPHPRGFDRLAYLASLFDVIEINVTFYRQPDPAAAHSWIDRVAAYPSFLFTAKLHRSFTHPGWHSPAGAEPPVELSESARHYRDGIAPLLEAGRLGAVLAQFPHAFHDREESRERLRTIRAILPDLPLVAEFRHRSWGHEGVLRFLNDLGIGFCNIDQPPIGSTLRPSGHVTSKLAYIRLHGRNGDNWFKSGESAAARYDYLYSMEELRPWVERADRLQERAEEVFIIANNHYRGKAPANALMVQSALRRMRVEAPPELVDLYPEMAEVTKPARRRPPAQGLLFDA
ncbi:MAG TPA: DUF72 domain-containing protein [Candidatus Polarisedimenticolia bacterium]|nr:DUF72 domain-containing protein [Candidatus Polarisedimenticolia bacterium]